MHFTEKLRDAECSDASNLSHGEALNVIVFLGTSGGYNLQGDVLLYIQHEFKPIQSIN